MDCPLAKAIVFPANGPLFISRMTPKIASSRTDTELKSSKHSAR
jgi:hypothetical protein